MNKITEHFYRWGWLVPALLPLTQLGGRALFTLVIWLYFLWGAAVFIRERITLKKRYLILFCILLISYALGISLAADPSRAFNKWINYFVMASVFPITWMVLQTQEDEAARRLVKWLAILGIAMVLTAYAQLIHLAQQPGFSPTQQLKEDSMPYLLPFILLFFYLQKNAQTRWLGMIAATTIILFYVFLSEGRAAQLASVVALFLFFIAVLGIRWHIASLISILCLLAIVLGNLDTFIQLSGQEHGLYTVMNGFTSYRWELWDNALTHAPDWNLIGCGMGNIRYNEEILTFASGTKVAHLHNFVLDLWYETGWLGLLSFLTFIGAILYTTASRFAAMPFEKRVIVGTAAAGAGAILVAGLFSFSYNSRQFGVYLMLCLTLLLWSAQSTTARERDAG